MLEKNRRESLFRFFGCWITSLMGLQTLTEKWKNGENRSCNSANVEYIYRLKFRNSYTYSFFDQFPSSPKSD